MSALVSVRCRCVHVRMSVGVWNVNVCAYECVNVLVGGVDVYVCANRCVCGVCVCTSV